ncbi:MAG: polyphenol oxidase family protein, partial [Bdellovibrionales bacterium]|nr:polyphenol oxidase family protein [Bdellovibrionales bacterium]
QVHSSLWIEAQNSDNLSADAHFTSRKNKALLIRTADCMPILMRNGDRIAAVHAGWRGLIHNILLNSTPPFLTRECQVCVGPHIQLSSFEVGQEVADEIKAFGETLGLVKKDIMLPHQDSKKIWVSLASLARAQIESSGAQLMMMSTQDTLTSSDYFSYRRNSRETGRQISFVVRHC